MSFIPMLEKAVAQGTIISAVSYFCYPRIRSIRVNFTRRPISAFALFAVMGAASSLVSDGIHTFVKEEIHINEKANDEASLLVGTCISAASLYCVMYLANPRLAAEYGYGCAIAAGAAGEFGASFLVNLFAG